MLKYKHNIKIFLPVFLVAKTIMNIDKDDKVKKVDDADSHFEAENLNKYDCLNLKEKNLVINSYETEYVDPTNEEVKDVKNNPDVNFEEVKNRDPNQIFKEDLKKD